ncbi:MAG: T9SS type A sorting domain-containing protein [Flavobacteriales bacterium]|nr:T9SS type A sorting domain-containing protein [Flavobacteriales bacterium]
MARYDGMGWSRMVSTPSTLYGATNGPVKSLVFHEGKLYVGGDFTTVDVNAGIPVGQLATYNWNSTPEWEAVGTSGLSGNSVSAEAMTLWNDRVLIAGRFEAADGVDSRNMVIYDEVAGFISINTGSFTGQIGRARCLAIQDGKVYAGGDYSNIGLNNLFGLNAYDGTDWLDLNAEVGIDRRALYACDEDHVWVGGHLEELGADVNNLFIYDVVNDNVLPFSDDYWGVSGIVNAIVEYDGELYIAGEFDMLMGSNGHPDAAFDNIFKVNGFCGTAVGVVGAESMDDIEVFPNPANGPVTVSNIREGSTLTVTDMMGKAVRTSAVVGTQATIATEGFAKGVYLIRIENSGSAVNRKLVVNR